jgi:hypothetical protein
MSILKSKIPPESMSAALDILAKDCPKYQFIREFTQNSIEAGAEHVEWGVFKLQDGTPKLCITDDGCGMTPQEMIKLINGVFVSGKQQGIRDNFGIGAKISSVVSNKFGVIYQSWRNGKGYYIHYGFDNGDYGLHKVNEYSTGEESYYSELPDSQKPEMIKDHGTRVIFLGDSESDVTSLARFAGLSGDSHISEYLHHRYFDLNGVEIRAYDIASTGKIAQEGRERGEPKRPILGLKKRINDCASSSGVVDISDNIKVHWWIYEPKDKTSNRYLKKNGHIGILHKNEIFGLSSSKPLYSAFGIVFSKNKVFMLVEVLDGMPDSTRREILIDGQNIPLHEIGEQFRKQMPKEIAELQEAGGSKVNEDVLNQLKQELKDLLNLFSEINKIDLKGTAPMSPKYGATEEAGDAKSESSSSGGSGNGKREGVFPGVKRNHGTSTNLRKLLFGNNSESEAKGSAVGPDIEMPEPYWNKYEEGGFDGYSAARYDKLSNKLIINEDFEPFRKLVEYFKQQSSIEESRIVDVVKGAYQSQLIEYITVSKSLMKSGDGFEVSEYEESIEESSLTVVATMRLGLNTKVRQALKELAKA